MSGEEREGFLARWSRRKREAAAEPEALPDAATVPAPETAAVEPAPSPAVPETPSAPPAGRPACPIPNLPEIELSSLPPIEELTAESDFSLFLRPGVPSMLRHAALRRMWSLDPAIRDYIGPAEYQWDFNTPGGLPTGFAEELGGDVRKLLAQAIGKVEELAAEQEPEAPAAEAGPLVPEAEPVAEIEPPGVDETPAVSAAPEEPAGQPAVQRRRHGGALPT
jgi:hypothetical protein